MWMNLKSGCGGILPWSLRRVLRRHRTGMIRKRNHGRAVAEIFTDIYEHNRWGGERGSFHSGSGSTTEHARRYSGIVSAFINSHGLRRVVDLGCGDFLVGARLVETAIDYTGVDIVADLIRNNRQLYGCDRVRFECLDIIRDALPEGDLCLLRQVLQHLSNEQILQVLRNTEKYPYVIVTEHYPAAGALRAKNIDKPCGEDVRIYDGSAVFLDAPPFNRQVSGPLLAADATPYLMHPGERILTYLIENKGPAAQRQAARQDLL